MVPHEWHTITCWSCLCLHSCFTKATRLCLFLPSSVDLSSSLFPPSTFSLSPLSLLYLSITCVWASYPTNLFSLDTSCWFSHCATAELSSIYPETYVIYTVGRGGEQAGSRQNQHQQREPSSPANSSQQEIDSTAINIIKFEMKSMSSERRRCVDYLYFYLSTCSLWIFTFLATC